MKELLLRYGSAAITGMGGIGKTALMTAFAKRVELDGDVPGGVHWVTADGNATQIIQSLANFIETLSQSKISDKDLRDPRIIVSMLRSELGKSDGRWLLCMDNADNAGQVEIEEILEEVSLIADPVRRNGWVMVTSRSGQDELWTSMKSYQNIVLEPLSMNESMSVLWRFRESIGAKDASDDMVSIAIRQLQKNFPEEHSALRQLCGHGWRYSLAGLPLALVQAGSYIRRFKMKFSVYLKLYQQASTKPDLERILQKAVMSCSG